MLLNDYIYIYLNNIQSIAENLFRQDLYEWIHLAKAQEAFLVFLNFKFLDV